MRLSAAIALVSLPAALAAAAYTNADPLLSRNDKPTHHNNHKSAASSSSSSPNGKPIPVSSSSSTTSSKHHGKPIPTSSSASPSPGVTEIAVLTAGGVPWTVTSYGGTEVVDGKTLARGGSPIFLDAQSVSEDSKGRIVVGQTTIKFRVDSAPASSSTTSSSPAAGNGASSSSSPSPAGPTYSSSGAAASSSSTTSSGNGAPTRAAEAGIVVLGGIVGALLL